VLRQWSEGEPDNTMDGWAGGGGVAEAGGGGLHAQGVYGVSSRAAGVLVRAKVELHTSIYVSSYY
jgi:hypothetical protein